jgi:hypothetical protein
VQQQCVVSVGRPLGQWATYLPLHLHTAAAEHLALFCRLACTEAGLSALNLFSRHQVRAVDTTKQIAVRAVVKTNWQEQQQLYDCSVMFQKVVSIIISIAAVAATALDYVMCKFSRFNPPLMYEPLSHQGVTRTNDPP